MSKTYPLQRLFLQRNKTDEKSKIVGQIVNPQRKDYILSNESYRSKTRNTNRLHDTKLEIGSNEAIYEIESSSDSSNEYSDDMDVEIEIESSKEERKHIQLNEKFMTHYKSNIKKPETTKNQLLNTQKITYHNEFDLRKSYNESNIMKSK